MSPKEKAEALINKYLKASFNCSDCDMPYCDVKCTSLCLSEAKDCALISVDEILEALDLINERYNEFPLRYYTSVKAEIERL